MSVKTKYTGTQTEKNLEAAFAGESMARNKYTYFASKAKKDGYEQIADLFLKTADNDNLILSLFLSRNLIFLSFQNNEYLARLLSMVIFVSGVP